MYRYTRTRHFSQRIHMTLFPFILMIVILGGSVIANDTDTIKKVNPLGFFWGLDLSNVQTKDKALAPLRWTGPRGLLLAGITINRPQLSQSAILNCGIAYYENRYGHQGADIHFGFDYRIVRPNCVKFSLGSLGFGGTIEGQQRNNYFFSWDDAHLYWFNSLSIDPVVDYQFSLCKSWYGSLSIELALLSFVSRPTLFKMNKQDAMTKFGFYFYETNKDASFELPDDYQHLCVDLGVNHVLHRSSVYIGYKFTLDRYQQPAPVISVSHGLVVKQFFGRTALR